MVLSQQRGNSAHYFTQFIFRVSDAKGIYCFINNCLRHVHNMHFVHLIHKFFLLFLGHVGEPGSRGVPGRDGK